MAIWFVRTDGTDSIAGVANGRDALGLSLVNASYDHTGNGEGERHLSSTGAFSGYTFTAGDTIYLLNAVGGVADGLYEISSKVDDDAILLVADSGLTADSTADVDSSDGAFATIAYGLNEGNTGNTAFADGDELRICANASHTSADTITIDTIGGSSTAPLIITGATATGLVDGTRATVDFTGTATTEDGFLQSSSLAAASVILWKHLRITAAARHNIMMDEPNSLWQFYDCRIDNAGRVTATGDGIHNNITGGVQHYCKLILCEVDNNANNGIGHSNANRQGPNVIACSIHDNGDNGIMFGEGSIVAKFVVDSLIYDNGGHGIAKLDYGVTSPEPLTIIGCTIDGNTSNGVELTNAGDNGLTMIINTTISNNGGFGVDLNTRQAKQLGLINCWLYNNNGGGDQFSDSYSGSDLLQFENCTEGTDPQYTSTTDGSEDFSPLSGSGLVGAGIPGAITGGTGYMDIGAIQRRMLGVIAQSGRSTSARM